MTHYDTLQVPNNASKGEISKAYRKLAFQYHPDRNPGDKKAVKSFRMVTEAYSVVSNEVKRARYDRSQPTAQSLMEEILQKRIDELKRRQKRIQEIEREYQAAQAYLARQEAMEREMEMEAKRTQAVLNTLLRAEADRTYKDFEYYSIVAMAIILGILACLSLINSTWIPLLFIPAVVQVRLSTLTFMKRKTNEAFGIDS